MFQHELLTAITCPQCRHTSHGKEINLILGVNFSAPAPLNTILRRNTFATNILHGRKCDQCHTTVDTPQVVRLGKTPDVLVLQLRRFEWNGTKKMAHIALDEELDLTPFTSGQIQCRYQLRSVVLHQGTMNSGHYKTVARGPSGWAELDDLQVSTGKTITAARDPAGKYTPYLLFWIRI